MLLKPLSPQRRGGRGESR